MRPRLKAAENAPPCLAHPVRREASMRPRLKAAENSMGILTIDDLTEALQ